MRRSDREVTDFEEIVDILSRADTIRLGLHDNPYPYVVPLSFGWEVVDGKISIYVHGAQKGLRHRLIAKNPRVCVEADICHGFVEVPGSVTTEYESLIGFGQAQLVRGREAIKGLDLLLTHCGYEGYRYDHAVMVVTTIYKVTLDTVTGKRRFV